MSPQTLENLFEMIATKLVVGLALLTALIAMH
jgi:hypothetical protein